jgi:Ca-activated chloride channel family protein
MVNYFSYDVPPPQNGEAFGVTVEVSACPWQPAHQLARIAVRAQDVAPATRPTQNLVFLIDVSGSMQPENRLPLIKTGLSLLTTTLRDQDRIAIVTYANSANVVLPSTAGTDQRTILKAIDGLTADGGTNGGSGIQLAYQAARERFVPGGINRVILCTDGDFNVGVTNRDELVGTVQERAKQGIFLTVLGVGQDNLKDATMELLADKANGHYHYLDTIAEARKVLIEQGGGTLMTVAKDVKAQVEFNPARIAAWRQLGYEKRALAAQDFNDDRKDAGEVGAGHQVTMLYELVPATVTPAGEGLRYQVEPPPIAAGQPGYQDELMTVKVRYKAPDAQVSRLVQGVVTDAQVRRTPSDDQTFAAAVAAFALRLRGAGAMPLDWSAIRGLANGVRGRDPQGYRQEFVTLIERVARLEGQHLPRE